MVPARPEWARRVADLRLSLGITRAQFAHLMAVSYPTIWRWESGEDEPTRENWRRLAELAHDRGSDRDYFDLRAGSAPLTSAGAIGGVRAGVAPANPEADVEALRVVTVLRQAVSIAQIRSIDERDVAFRMRVPASMCPNEGSVFGIPVPDGSMAPSLTSGQIAIVDATAVKARELVGRTVVAIAADGRVLIRSLRRASGALLLLATQPAFDVVAVAEPSRWRFFPVLWSLSPPSSR
ncbi:MAG TPA: helix-turn-helix domain-containing protein [Terriglobales bacterium]|nr:helix-turn-helix domain-containing protein [Terriglobales bacterium]